MQAQRCRLAIVVSIIAAVVIATGPSAVAQEIADPVVVEFTLDESSVVAYAEGRGGGFDASTVETNVLWIRYRPATESSVATAEVSLSLQVVGEIAGCGSWMNSFNQGPPGPIPLSPAGTGSVEVSAAFVHYREVPAGGTCFDIEKVGEWVETFSIDLSFSGGSASAMLGFANQVMALEEDVGGLAEPGDTVPATGEADSIDRDDGGGRSLLLPAVVVLAVALLVLILTLLRRRSASTPMHGDRVVEAATGILLLEPERVISSAQQAMEAEAEKAKAAKAGPPQFTPSEEPIGELRVSEPVDAISPSGERLTLPPGTFPSGSTVTSEGKGWTAVRHGTEWWWVPAAADGFERVETGIGVPEGTPEKLSPLPYRTFELTEGIVFEDDPQPGRTTRHSLGPGRYELGPVETTPDGDVYQVWKKVDGTWKSQGRIPEKMLPQSRP